MADAIQVKIIYTGPIADEMPIGGPLKDEFEGMNIPRLFAPTNSYIDSPVYTEGYEVGAEAADKKYGKSIYATNVDGWGWLPGLLPMASTTVKFAQYERAAMAAFEAKQKDEKNEGITFEVEGYMEEIYWNQIAPHMVDFFFTQVGDNKYGEEPDTDSEGV